MDVEINGLDELQSQLESLEGEHEIPFADLFPEPWMQAHTDHESIEVFVEERDWDGSTQEEFEAIPDEPWDEYVNENSVFEDWKDMYQTAADAWVGRQL